MSNTPNTTNREEWLKILGKGMITIPKEWRDELGIKTGDVIKAKKEGKKLIFEASANMTPHRIYTVGEIRSFMEEDKIDSELKDTYKKILQKTRGAWKADKTLDATMTKRSLIERKASTRRKQPW